MGAGARWVHTWHPNPEHPLNKPHAVGELVTRNSIKKRIHVAAPGILDGVSAFEGCESPSWAADW